MMVTQVTHGIKITVQTTYQELYSRPDQNYYLFSYRIFIENNSEYTVQLLRRHWFIFDSIFNYTEVEGEGVIGVQPHLSPGETYEYESACELQSDIGKMHGYYLMKRETDGFSFDVAIPAFELIAPNRLS